MSWKEWPIYSTHCRTEVLRLLSKGTSLSAYRSNPEYGVGPREGSWAWRLERLAERVHAVPYVVACSSGTTALVALLKALQFPPGSEVITTAFTFSATLASILHAGYIPAFADVDIPTCVLSELSWIKMGKGDALPLPVDLFGAQAPRFYGCVADSCQAVGLVPVAHHGVWSFNGRKNVPAGEGGAVYTTSSAVADRVRQWISHGENFGGELGINSRMNEVTACIAWHGMQQVLGRNAHRTRMAHILNEQLATQDVIVPDLSKPHALYTYPLILPGNIERVGMALKARGVACQPGYIQPPLHRYKAFQWTRRDELVNTESLSKDRLILFPQVTPTATEKEMVALGKAIKACL